MIKKNILTKILVLSLIAIISIGFTGCGKIDTLKRIKKDNVVIMGTNAEFAPFEYRNEQGEVDGFDPAIAKEIAKELGVELKIEDMAFGALIGALDSGKIDFVAAGMTVNEDRLESADFSESYFNASQVIIVKKENDKIKGKDDLKGKKIGVQEGTTGGDVAEEIEGTTVSRYSKGLDAVMDLKNGKVDAVVIDSYPAQVFASKNDDIKILDENMTTEEYAIAVRKNDKEFVETINKVLKDLKDSGKYDELYKKHIGE